MNKLQNRKFHAIIKAKGLDKSDIVSQATGGRSTSSKDMTDAEAEAIIGKLTEGVAGQSKYEALLEKQVGDMRKAKQMPKAFFLFRESGYYNAQNKPDYDRINAFCKNRTAAKKVLNDMTAEEVTELITQLKQMSKNFKK